MASSTGTRGASAGTVERPERRTYRGPFAVMTILFFVWGFMSVWNDILIPRFKDAFHLDYFQAMLVALAFCGAYFAGSLAYYLISMYAGDPINHIGYKNGVIIGLLIAAAGSFLFYPAALLLSYPFFLVALFIVGLGFAMLQIAANPYITILGPERTASSRLNLSQAFNSLGTTIGPIVAGYLIFKVFNGPGSHGAQSVKIPYLCFGGVFLALAVCFAFADLPNFTNVEHIPRGAGALAHPHTVLGMLAIFMYVGGEVCVGSSIINFMNLPALGGLSHQAASKYLSFFWGGLMIGRFMGAFALSTVRKRLRTVAIITIPILAFVTIRLISGRENALHYGVLLAAMLVMFYLGSSSPQRMLALFSLVIIALLLTGMLSVGATAIWAILGIGLFDSIMWSNIFSLAIEGLGPLKSQAASVLMMAVLGGALMPPLQGIVADHFGIQFSFIVPMFSYAFITFYGVYGYRAGRRKESVPLNPEVIPGS